VLKRKIAIVGGGMAGLAAAFDLTRTEALRNKFDVTIYQMGWRLGGKAASSRDRHGRIVEHGLHVWFGCYENAFELVKAAYAAWDPLPGQAIKDPKHAFQGQSRTAMGSGDKLAADQRAARRGQRAALAMALYQADALCHRISIRAA
jgi:uncharacterized protein with NAD-binding domain and iron-sulfur cluster